MPNIEPVSDLGIDVVFRAILENGILSISVNIVEVTDRDDVFPAKPIFERRLGHVSDISGPSPLASEENLAW
jgi:hypothetical protein